MDSSKHPIDLKTDQGVIEGEVILESGPRSLRPRGSRGSASTLKLVSLRPFVLADSLWPSSSAEAEL
jgi:oxygen-dependent protoporphyrinogen oxidase